MAITNRKPEDAPEQPAPVAEAKPKQQPQVVKPRSIRAVDSRRVQLAVHAAADVVVTPLSGETVEDVLHPAYWYNQGYHLKPDSIIRAVPQDKKWFAEILVVGNNIKEYRSDPVLRLIRHVDLTDRRTHPQWSPDEYVVRQQGRSGFALIRTVDNAVIKDGYATADEAEAYRSHYLSRLE